MSENKTAIEMIKEAQEQSSEPADAQTSELTALLDGFEIVASDAVPSLTIDNQRRLYLNTSARRLLNVRPYDRLAVAYRPDTKSLAVITGEAAFAYPTSNYNVDKRYYMSARHLSRTYGFEPEGAPYTFVYERGAGDGSAFIFRLQSAE